MNKAYIVHYVGYDQVSDNFTFDLPDEIHSTKEGATEEFERMITEELENWDITSAKIERSEDCFYISAENGERWTEIRIKCVTIKE